MKTITVFISDDHAIFREALRSLLQAKEINVVGEAENGDQTLAEVKRLQPNVVLMNVAMPRLNGVDATRQITREVPGIKVLLLSSTGDDLHAQQAIEAGAAGYLTKETAAEELLRAIREVCKGNAFFSPPIAKRLLQRRKNGALQSPPIAPPILTGRQTAVMQLVAEGYSSKQISSILSVSVKTVENHRQALMRKLDIHDIASLTRYAVFSGAVGANPYDQLTNSARLDAPARSGRNEIIRPALRVLEDFPGTRLGQVS